MIFLENLAILSILLAVSFPTYRLTQGKDLDNFESRHVSREGYERIVDIGTTQLRFRRVCGTSPPSDYLLRAHQRLKVDNSTRRAAVKSTMHNVRVHFHVVVTADQARLVRPDMVANQFGVLQQIYAAANISFTLAGVDFTINNTWASDQADAEMKSELRKGNYSTLNLYFQSNLSTLAYGAPTQLLGYCSLPTNVTYMPCPNCAPLEHPSADYALDGCNILAGSMPGGPVHSYNLGKTAVHEVGHWFGLLHTFQGTSCDQNDPGDYIDDTPQQSVSTDGCPNGKDSCPNSPGLDPIHNFMDYSTDDCYEHFTSEQIRRIHIIYDTLRMGY